MNDQRLAFVLLASQKDANRARLSKRFGISRPTAYKWLARYQQEGQDGLHEHSRCPKRFAHPTPTAMEDAVLELRKDHPAWGGRKLRRVLQNNRAAGTLEGVDGLDIPAASTITRILSRNDMITEKAVEDHKPIQRFERPSPNELWQMDFKGDIMLGDRTKSYPLTMLDDHCRYNLCLQSCANHRFDTVYTHVRNVFRLYGLPLEMLMDNGTPWAHSPKSVTRFELWLLRLGITVLHGRVNHPQTQGKEERFHRTLKAEVLSGRTFPHARALQKAFDQWRHIYNYVRPHEAIDLDTPGERYQVSQRPYPEELPPIEYENSEIVRTVRKTGYIHFAHRSWFISEALGGQRIALRPVKTDGLYTVCYGSFAIGTLNLKQVQDKDRKYVRIHTYRSIRQIETNAYPFMENESISVKHVSERV